MTHPSAASAASAAPHAPHFDLDQFLHHTELPETGFSRAVDPIVRGIGKASSYLWVVLVAVITVNVAMRYVLGKGLIEFEELQWHLYAVAFLLGIAWVLEGDNHVRIDVLYEHWSFRTKCWIELVGMLVALLPFIALVLWYSAPFVAYSFRINEISEAPGGLPMRWAIKAFLLIGFAVLGLAAVSRLTRVIASLFLLGQVDRERIFELTKVRAFMECWAAREAARNRSEADVAAIRGYLEEMERDFERGQIRHEVDFQFHAAIAAASRNTSYLEQVTRVYSLINLSIKVFREQVFVSREGQAAILDQHRKIFNAIREGKPEAAEAAMREHLDFVLEQYQRRFYAT